MRVLHVNDIARIGSALVHRARAEGLDWDLYDTARTDPAWSPRTRAVRRALRGARWEAGLVRRAARADLLDVHGATVTAHTAWLPCPYVLHLHGTDIRVRRYEPGRAALVERAVARARDVYYTTPDLAEHVLDLRPDATLQPVVVDVDELPRAREHDDGPLRVFFPSRWDAAKGGDLQLAVVDALRAAHGTNLVMEGLDWGNGAAAACGLGVVLRPPADHASYVRRLAGAALAVGQMTGCMGVSELEAVGSGVTTVMPLEPAWYDGAHSSTRDVPVLVGATPRAQWVDAVVDAVGQVLDGRRIIGGRDWVEANHSPRRAVASLRGRFEALGPGRVGAGRSGRRGAPGTRGSMTA